MHAVNLKTYNALGAYFTFQSGGNWAPNPKAGNILSLQKNQEREGYKEGNSPNGSYEYVTAPFQTGNLPAFFCLLPFSAFFIFPSFRSCLGPLSSTNQHQPSPLHLNLFSNILIHTDGQAGWSKDWTSSPQGSVPQQPRYEPWEWKSCNSKQIRQVFYSFAIFLLLGIQGKDSGSCAWASLKLFSKIPSSIYPLSRGLEISENEHGQILRQPTE